MWTPRVFFEIGFCAHYQFLFTIHHTSRNNPPHCLQNVDATSQGTLFGFCAFGIGLLLFLSASDLCFLSASAPCFLSVSALWEKKNRINVPNLKGTWPAEKMHESLVRQCLKLMSLLLTKKATGESWYAFNRLVIRRLVTIACVHYIF